MVVVEFYNIDEYYYKMKDKGEVFLLNDLQLGDPLLESLTTNIVEDTIKEIPKCLCGETMYAYNKGIYCEECDTEVTDRAGDFDPILFVEIPDNVVGFLNPSLLQKMKILLSTKDREIMKHFYDRRSMLPIDAPILDDIKKIKGYTRTYNFFISNLENILMCIINNTPTARSSGALEFLKVWKSLPVNVRISNYIPFLSPKIMIMEKTPSKHTHAFKDVFITRDIIRGFLTGLTLEKNMGSIVGKMIDDMAGLLENTQKQLLGGRGGIVKGYLLGLRSAFTMRCVMTSIQWSHDIDELRLPWGASIIVYTPHITNYLKRKGYSHMEITNKLMTAVTTYDKEIDDAFLWLESYLGYLPVMIMRNPAQSNYGSIALKGRVKRDVEDTSISISALIAVIMQMDFDGDDGNVTIPLDMWMWDRFKVFKEKYIIGGNLYGSMYGGLELRDESTAIVSNRITEERKGYDG